jgi:1,4-dihydroxy-6-naphthoate synthase
MTLLFLMLLVNHKIDTEGIGFEVVLEDVQTLNHWALGKQISDYKT